MTRKEAVKRRKFLTTSGMVATALFAGCAGGDGSDGSGGGDGSDGSGGGDGGPSGRVTLLTTPSGTAGYSMGNAMASLLSEDTDLTGSSSAGSGSGQNVVQVMRGEADITRAVTPLLVKAYNREEPMDMETEYKPLQLFSHLTLRLPLAVQTSSDFEYYEDLSGVNVARAPQAASFQPALDRAYGSIIENHQPVYQSPNEMGATLAAGNVQSAVLMNTNGLIPSFSEEIAARNNLRLLGIKEENQATLRDNDNIDTTVYPNENYQEVVDEFVMEEESFMPVVNYAMISSGATSEEVVYTFCNTIYDNQEQLPEAHPAFSPWTEKEWYTKLVDPRLPFHPGAEQFLKEKGLWEDEFKQADM